MRYGLFLGVASAALCVAAPALADVTIVGTIDVDKTIDVDETISIATDVDLNVAVELEAEKFAESIAIANQSNYNNEACDNCAEKDGIITGSAVGNTGVVSINQAVGNMNNQGTLISIAVDAAGNNPVIVPEGNSGFAESLAAADQRNGTPEALAGDDGSYSDGANTIDTVNIVFRNASIADSFNTNAGLVYGNQASGHMANQVNVLSLAFAIDDNGVALAEADLGQVNANSTVAESGDPDDDFALGVCKVAATGNSLNGNTGIVGVNQSVGNLSNQANIVSIAAVGTNLPTF